MANQQSVNKTEGPNGGQGSTTDQILDLLLDALIERQRARRTKTGAAARPKPPPEKPQVAAGQPQVAAGQPQAAAGQPQAAADKVPPPRPEPPPSEQRRAAARPARRALEPKPGDEGWEPPPRQPSVNMGKTMGRLAILVVVLIILVNIPVTRYGVSLARILPETTSLIIRDGLVLKGSGPEIYVLEQDRLRWISSMDAFEHLGLTWGDVHIVEDAFLAKFEKGRAIHVLLKCSSSPHIYRLENEEKRWIRDIQTFEAEGHVWDDVRFVGCQYLRDLPDGAPIPEDAGPPPQP
jgi:hypothetical protein